MACLNLTKLVDSVTERMQVQKKGVREAKKKIKAEQKEIAKMQAKVAAAEAKAQKKLDRAVERERIKAEAKKNREEAKQNAKNNKAVQVLQEVQGVDQAEVQVPTVLRPVGSTESGQINGELERAEPDNEVPGQVANPGAVRYKASNGDEITTNPHDPLYSAALFAAQEVLTEAGWEPIEGKPDLPEPSVPNVADVVYEEAPVVHRKFVIPEEG